MEERYFQRDVQKEESNLQYNFNLGRLKRPIFIWMKNTIKKRTDFKEVYEKGNSYATKNLVLFVLKKGATERNRYGISVSHKVGNSVVRHTLIRRIREIYRIYEGSMKEGYDIVCVLRVGSEKAKFLNLQEDFLSLSKRLELYKERD